MLANNPALTTPLPNYAFDINNITDALRYEEAAMWYDIGLPMTPSKEWFFCGNLETIETLYPTYNTTTSTTMNTIYGMFDHPYITNLTLNA